MLLVLVIKQGTVVQYNTINYCRSEQGGDGILRQSSAECVTESVENRVGCSLCRAAGEP